MIEEEEPSPEPEDGMSASIVISTPCLTPVMSIASRTRSWWSSSTLETISFFE